MLAVARGKDPAAEKRAERGAGTFAELAARYLEQLRQEAEQELAAGRRARAPLPAAALGQAAGGEHHARRRPRHDGPHRGAGAGQPGAGGGLGDLLAGRSKQEIVAANPCRGVERNATRSRERVLSDSEVPKFWTAFDDAGLVVVVGA